MFKPEPVEQKVRSLFLDLTGNGDLHFFKCGPKSYSLLRVERSDLEEEEGDKIINLLKEDARVPGGFEIKKFYLQEDQTEYYIIEKVEKIEGKKSRLLTKIQEYDDKYFNVSSLIIFPIEDSYMIYAFGDWYNNLINHAILMDKWGVRVAGSETMFNPKAVKMVSSKEFLSSNPSITKEQAQRPKNFEEFKKELGSEYLHEIRFIPDRSVIKTDRLLRGSDAALYFSVNTEDLPSSSYFENEKEKTLRSLYEVAKQFHDIPLIPHEVLAPYIDSYVTDSSLIKELIKKLDNEISTNMGRRNILFQNDFIFKNSSNKRQKMPNMFEKLKDEDKLTLSTKVTIEQKEREQIKLPVIQIFDSLPFEYSGNFYRLENKHWYKVNESRFSLIEKILKKRLRPQTTFGLIDYTGEKGNSYQEAYYNEQAVKAINDKHDGSFALCLDGSNVILGKNSETFEFGDLLICRGNEIYIVHVKRSKRRQLSHHREQVERTVDYLNSLGKRGSKELVNFLLGIASSVSSKSKEEDKKRKIPKSSKIKHDENDEKDVVFKGTDEYLEKHNVLHYEDRDYLPPSKKNDDSYPACKLSNIFTRLFNNGPLSIKDKKHIHLVLAVIDDREKKEPSDKKEDFLFKKQNLWGLDRTRSLVEKTGMKFDITIIDYSKETKKEGEK